MADRRRRRSPLPLIIGGGIALLTLLGIGIGVMWSLGSNSNTKAITKATDSSAASNNEASQPPASIAAASSIDSAALLPLGKSVLALEITSPAGTTRGACFLVGAKGYAVTSAHLIAKASRVVASHPDGVKIDVGGVAASDTAHDLAIIKLEPTLPVSLEPLVLEPTSPALGADLAVISPAEPSAKVSTGKFKSSDHFAKLSPALRSKLKGTFSEWADDTEMLLHSVPLDVASIGAPLVREDGRVIGLQVAFDASGGVAVHARHIATLLESAGSEIKPFGMPAVATNDPPPTIDPLPTPTPVPETPDDPIDALLERLAEHRDACAKMNWTARDAVDYAQFQLLAKFVNEAAAGADTVDVPPEIKEKLEAGVRTAMFSLTAEKWPDEASWNETNRQAAKGLETPGQGVFALVRITVPTAQGNMFGDVPIAVGEIVGQSQMVVLPFKSGGEKFGVDARLLVVGMHDPTVSFTLNNIQVPLVRTKYVLAVEKQD